MPSSDITTPIETLRARFGAQLTARVPEHLERLRWSAPRLADHQRDGVRALLRHALEHSPFHARRLRGIDPDRFALADLPSLPTMSKAEMMASFDDVVTDRRLSLQLANDHAERLCHSYSSNKGYLARRQRFAPPL